MKKFFDSQMLSTGPSRNLTPQKILGKVLLGSEPSKIQKKMLHFLERWAEEVTFAEDGRSCFDEALDAKNEGQPFDLILLDTDLPVLDAYSITRLLRENDYPAAIVSFSQEYFPLYDYQSEEAGCDGHILESNMEHTLPGFFGWEKAAANF